MRCEFKSCYIPLYLSWLFSYSVYEKKLKFCNSVLLSFWNLNILLHHERQMEPSVKTFRSQLSVLFLWICMSNGGNQRHALSCNQSEKMKIINITLPQLKGTHNRRLYCHMLRQNNHIILIYQDIRYILIHYNHIQV